MTNREHYFDSELIFDTIMLLTYDNHRREECRRFKDKLKNMNTKDLEIWLNSKWDKSEFHW